MNGNIDRMLDILTAEKDLYSDMLDLSKKKRDVIVNNNIEELDTIVKNEQIFLHRLGELEFSRQAVLEQIAAIMNVDSASLTSGQILENVSADRKNKINSVINQLSDILKEQSEINQVNMNLIESNLDYINNIISAVIMGDKKVNTYNGSGNKVSRQQRNIIDQIV